MHFVPSPVSGRTCQKRPHFSPAGGAGGRRGRAGDNDGAGTGAGAGDVPRREGAGGAAGALPARGVGVQDTGVVTSNRMLAEVGSERIARVFTHVSDPSLSWTFLAEGLRSGSPGFSLLSQAKFLGNFPDLLGQFRPALDTERGGVGPVPAIHHSGQPLILRDYGNHPQRSRPAKVN